VLGAKVSFSTALDPDVVSAVAASQLAPLTVQVNVLAAQGVGGGTTIVEQACALGALH
jgi:hypothetical protein